VMRFAIKPCRPCPNSTPLSKSAWATRQERGSQLFEFALVLPLLCVLLVGIIEFAQGFILKQKLTNAAREGARIAVQQSRIDVDQPLPNSTETIGDAILYYLENAAIDRSIITTPPTKTGAAGEWTYYSGSDALIVIDRSAAIEVPPGSGAFTIGARVTVRYPYSWSFSEVIKLVAPSSTYASSFLISTDVVMKQVID